MFGLPVVFDTDCTEIGPGASVLLKYGGKDIAVLDVEDKFEPNKPNEVLKCYGTRCVCVCVCVCPRLVFPK